MDLPRPCRWIHDDAGSYLQWNAACVGSVKTRGDAWLVSLSGWGIVQEHACANRGQGIRYLERWVCVRGGLPGFGSRAQGRKRTAAVIARKEAALAQIWVAASRKLPEPARLGKSFTDPAPENSCTQVYEWPSESP